MSQSEDPYKIEEVPLFEALYGKNLISLGNVAAIDNIFSGIDLNGLKLLDIGFGLGGIAFYLAKKYQIEVAGVEVHPWMIEYAKKHSSSDIAHLLKFEVYNEKGDLPFESSSFDLVYSKGVLNHVKNKLPLFQEIYRVLKKDGLFVIADWIYADNGHQDDSDPLVKETKKSYQDILENSGFENIYFRDDSQIFLGYVNQLLDNLKIHQVFIEKNYGNDVFLNILQDHQALIEQIMQKTKSAVHIRATKL